MLEENRPWKFIEARFVSRPNRFIVECLIGQEKTRAYLPNPGRLWELLLPGVRLYVIENPLSPERTTRYTAIAVEKEGVPVMLHTHHANTIVSRLIEKSGIPGLEGYRVVRPEVPCGKSRFDFLLERAGAEFLLEVKSCSLFGREIAMFPDAATERGRRHLRELADLSRRGRAGGVLFLVHSSTVRYFMPEYHTDLAFAQTLKELKNDIYIKAVGLGWKSDLTPDDKVKELEIPWDLVERETCDSGNYILILYLKKGLTIKIGGLGERGFRRGYYLYVGSAATNLTARIHRHLRRRKKLFWHIDYLNQQADFLAALPVRSTHRLECELAEALKDVSGWAMPGFGVSDCSCNTHLFGMDRDPITSPSFIKLLQYFRIDRLGIEIGAQKSEAEIEER